MQAEVSEIGELLSSSDVADFLGVRTATLMGMVRRREVPQPIRINARVLRWPRSVIQEFVDRKIAQASGTVSE